MKQSRRGANVAPRAATDPLQAALAWRAQGRIEQALHALSVPGEFSSDFFILRGDLELELGRVHEAAASYATVTADEPDHIYAQSQLGLCLQRLENWDGAAQAFEAVIEFDPHRDEIRLNLADCLLKLKRFAAALECFDQCWSETSQRRALFGKAVSLQYLRRFDEAERHYDRLLTVDPYAEEALANMIAMAIEVFDLARIEKHSQRLLEINSHSVTACKGLALCAIERSDFTTAARYYKRVAELEPDITSPSEDVAGGAEYGITREVSDSLDKSRRKAKHQGGGTTDSFGSK